jgi:hypothetical protein
MRRQFHLSYPRDDDPIACDCVIGHDHDIAALTYDEACHEVDRLIMQFHDDLGVGSSNLSNVDVRNEFAKLSVRVQAVIVRTGVLT